MLKPKTYILFLLAISFASCHSNAPAKKNAIAADTLDYTYKNFKVRDSACGNNPDSSCTIVKIAYPDFADNRSLNDSIAGKFINLFAASPDKNDTSLQQLANNFIGGYTAFKKVEPKSTLFFLLDGHAKVLHQDSAMLTIEISGYSYHGSPHGVDYTSYINWNAKTNKSIKLNDIFIAGYNKPLNRIAEQLFRKNEKLSDTSSLNNNRTYFFKDNKFSLPNNYLITKQGIKFLYNIYTIKPYAAGKTYLLIPYGQIQSLLLPGSVLKK